MKAYMTNGTLEYLQYIVAPHRNFNFHFMYNGSGTLVYYETDKKSIFSAARKFEMILTAGIIKGAGYVVIINIPLTEEGIPIFVDHLRKEINQITAMPGFQALRLLRSVKGNTYVILSQWSSKATFEAWRDTDRFITNQKNKSFKLPAHFAARPFSVNYIMVDDSVCFLAEEASYRSPHHE